MLWARPAGLSELGTRVPWAQPAGLSELGTQVLGTGLQGSHCICTPFSLKATGSYFQKNTTTKIPSILPLGFYFMTLNSCAKLLSNRRGK